MGRQPAAFQPLGGTGGDAGSCAGVPALYLAVPINNQWALGIGINAPFGLKTNYDSDWIGRFQAVESKVETLNVNPAVSFKVNDMWTIGGGINYQHLESDAHQAGELRRRDCTGRRAGRRRGADPRGRGCTDCGRVCRRRVRCRI